MQKIPFNKPYKSKLAEEFLLDVLSEERYYGCGKYTNLATNLIGEISKAKNVLLTDSCSSALDIIALYLRKLFPNIDASVVLPSYTFSSTANAFAKVGFKLKFCDVSGPDMTAGIEQVSKVIDSTTIAVVAVHYGLNIAPVDHLRHLCDELNLYLVEDAAQLFGATYNEVKIGNFGHFAAFSFHETKNLHCGLGGALIFRDSSILDTLTAIWERGTNRQQLLRGVADKYTWTEIGGSYYPTELQAALLYSQLIEFEQNNNMRANIYNSYIRAFEKYKPPNVLYVSKISKNVRSNYHSIYILTDTFDQTNEVLRSKGISGYMGYVPLHSSPIGIKLSPETVGCLPMTESLAPKVMRLPFYVGLKDSEIDLIVRTLSEVAQFKNVSY